MSAFVYAARAVFGKFGGGPARVRPNDLTVAVFAGLLAKDSRLRPAALEDVGMSSTDRVLAARCHAVSITAFDADGAYDDEAQRAHFRRLADAGVAVLVGSSAAGEGYTLSTKEWHRLLEAGRDELKGRVPFSVMAVESRTAAATIELLDIARQHEVDSVHLFGLEVGHGGVPDSQEVEIFMRDILDHVEVPVYLCHQPAMIGYGLPVSTVLRLVRDYPLVVGVLDTTKDVRYLADIKEACGADFELLSTLDQAPAVLAIGGHGFLCGEANIAPQLCASMIDHFTAGSHAQAFEDFGMRLRLNRIIARTVSASSQVHTYKAALHELGLPGGEGLRPPRRPLPAADRQLIGELVATHVLPELSR